MQILGWKQTYIAIMSSSLYNKYPGINYKNLVNQEANQANQTNTKK